MYSALVFGKVFKSSQRTAHFEHVSHDVNKLLGELDVFSAQK